MAQHLIDVFSSYITPQVVENLAQLLGENRHKTEKAIAEIVPALFGGVAHLGSTQEGAAKLTDLINDGNYPFKLVEDLAPNSAEEVSSRGLIKHGRSLLRHVLGGQYRADSVVNAIAQNSGVRNFSCLSLTSFFAPPVLAFLAKEAGSLTEVAVGGLSKSLIAPALALLPAGLASLVGLTAHVPTDETAANKKGATVVAAGVAGATASAGWLSRLGLPLLFLAFVAGAIALFARGCQPVPPALKPVVTQAPTAPDTTHKVESVALPTGEKLALTEGSLNYGLAKFLASPDSLPPKTFVFDHLNFTTGTTNVTPESEQTLKDLVAILKAYPSAQVSLEGHTDNVGSAAVNKRLSQNRAIAIKNRLVTDGIEAARILRTDGFGPDKPIADNATEEGRAQNRRLELVLEKK